MNIQDYLLNTFPNGGYFVEAGAHDGIGDSQTYALEQTGKWRGLCIEPSRAGDAICKKRTCKVDRRVLWDHDGGYVLFREMDGNAVELSGVPVCFGDHWDRNTRPHHEFAIPAVSLTTVLDQHGAPPTIEFLSLDTEGSELRILTAHDFDRFRFLVIEVEHNNVDEKRSGLFGMLSMQKGYSRIYDDEVNSIYVIEG